MKVDVGVDTLVVNPWEVGGGRPDNTEVSPYKQGGTGGGSDQPSGARGSRGLIHTARYI